MGNTDMESTGADNNRCPYCGTDRGDIENEFEAHVLNCNPIPLRW